MQRFFIVGALLLCSAGSNLDAQSIRPGTRAPEIDLQTLDGSRIKLSNLRGHAVVVSFWGSWCGPCREEFPALINVQSRYALSGLIVLAVNGRDQERSTSDVRHFIDSYGVSFPVVLDKRGSTRRSYRIELHPTTVFIDSFGIIRRVHTGLISPAQLDSGIATLIRKN